MKVYTSNWHRNGILSRFIEAEDQSNAGNLRQTVMNRGKPRSSEISPRYRESNPTRFNEEYVNASSRRWQSVVLKVLDELAKF